ncbi:MAG TPA: hypothetical protein DCZ73_09810 [Bacteroides sp.]|nr:hypothetical protein [Phocaeicola coprophilus]HBB08031.1 hypothetical protein [Bacteroides sp.]
MNANFNFTAEEMNIITSLTQELVQNTDATKSTKDNLVAMLQERVPSCTEGTAANIVAELLKGATDFTDRFEELCKGQDTENNLYERCLEMIKDRTPQEQAACILNFVALLKTLDTTVLGSLLEDANADVLARFETFKSLNPQVAEDISDEQLAELRECLRDAIDNSSICIAGDEQMKELLHTLDTDPELAKTLVEKGLQDLDYKAYAALAAYIAYRKGQLPSMPDELNAELLGASVAAGVERSKIITGAQKGWISWDKAFSLLKLLGGALLMVLFAWVGAHIFLFGVGLTCALIASLVGSATIGIVAGILIGGYSMYKALDWLYEEVAEPIMKGLGEAYDKVIDFFSQNDFIRRVRESLQRFWDYVTEKATSLFKRDTDAEKETVVVGN